MLGQQKIQHRRLGRVVGEEWVLGGVLRRGPRGIEDVLNRRQLLIRLQVGIDLVNEPQVIEPSGQRCIRGIKHVFAGAPTVAIGKAAVCYLGGLLPLGRREVASHFLPLGRSSQLFFA